MYKKSLCFILFLTFLLTLTSCSVPKEKSSSYSLNSMTTSQSVSDEPGSDSSIIPSSFVSSEITSLLSFEEEVEKDYNLVFYWATISLGGADYYISNAETDNWVHIETFSYCNQEDTHYALGVDDWGYMKVMLNYPYEIGREWKIMSYSTGVEQHYPDGAETTYEYVNLSNNFVIPNSQTVIYFSTDYSFYSIDDSHDFFAVPGGMDRCEYCGKTFEKNFEFQKRKIENSRDQYILPEFLPEESVKDYGVATGSK